MVVIPLGIDSFRRAMLIFLVVIILRPRPIMGRWRGVTGLMVMALTIPGGIDIPVPAVVNEIHRPPAGAISAAVSIPLFGMSGRHPEVEGRVPGADPVDDDRFRVYKPRSGESSDIDTTVKAWFSDTDGYTGMRLSACKSQKSEKHGPDCLCLFHVDLLNTDEKQKYRDIRSKMSYRHPEKLLGYYKISRQKGVEENKLRGIILKSQTVKR